MESFITKVSSINPKELLENDVKKANELQSLLDFKSSIKLTDSFKDYLALIDSVDLCFLGDGGGMHMAAALEINQVVLFGQTSTTTWSPLSDKAIILSDESDVNNIPAHQILSALQSSIRKIENCFQFCPCIY